MLLSSLNLPTKVNVVLFPLEVIPATPVTIVEVPIVVNVIPVPDFIKGIVTVKVVLTKGQNSVLSFGKIIGCPNELVIVANATLNRIIIFFIVNVFILLNEFVSRY